MSSFLFRRFWQGLIVIVGVVSLVFLLIHFVPGDPVDLMLGDTASQADKDSMRSLLGLDKSMGHQYIDFWRRAAFEQGGMSISLKKSVFSLLFDRFLPTLYLSLSSLFFALLIGVPLGVLMGIYANTKFDNLSLSLISFLQSLPIFVKAPIFILFFCVNLRWFPVSGFGTIGHFVLPTLLLVLAFAAWIARQLRAAMLETLNEDYIRTARAKGLSETRVYFLHALRNAMLPLITVVGQILGSMLAGAVLTETLFDWPGLGSLLYSAFQSRDYPLVQGGVMMVAGIYVFVGLFMDLAYAVIDPRIRVEGSSK